VLDDVAADFVKSTERTPKFPDLNLSHYTVWNELKQIMDRNQRQSFNPSSWHVNPY
jgi:hypothetical protein